MTAAEVTGWLDRLEETRQAATPGPWRWDADFGDEGDTGLALTNDAGEEIVGAYNTHCCAFRDNVTDDAATAASAAAYLRSAYKLRTAVAAALGAEVAGR